MRLRRLDLIRYGKFENRSLHFGERDGDSDVTVVYGDNEAGKSTAFAAWLDLLFGLAPRNHPYAFRFQRKELMVGAVIEAGDEVLELRRTGAPNGSLTDANGRAVDELRLKSLLHGLDRKAYQTRFSLDETVLREGGEEISKAQGDLGQLLHAGVSGLSGLSETLDAIETEIDGFHKKGGQKTGLRNATRELNELKGRLAEARLEPRRFNTLRQAFDDAERNLDERRKALSEAQALLALRETADRRREIDARMEDLRRALDGYPQGPALSPDAVGAVMAAIARRQDAVEGLAEARRKAAEAREAMQAETPDPAGLEAAAILEGLEEARFDDGQPLLARVQMAAADIEKVRAERATHERDAVGHAEAVDGPGARPDTLRLTRGVLATLRQRAQDLRDAQNMLEAAERTHAEALAELGPEIPMPAGLDALTDALEAYERLNAEPEALAREAARQRLAADRAAAGLPVGWRALTEANLPSEAEVVGVADALAERTRKVREVEARLVEAQEMHADVEARRASLLDRGDVATDEEIARTRAVREAAWTRHRAALDAATAEAFEAGMRGDDEARERHATSAEQRMELASVATDLARWNATVQRRRTDVEAAAAALDAARRDAAAMAARVGLPDDAPATAYRDRRTALAGAYDAALQADAKTREADAASATQEETLSRLAAAFAGAAGLETDPSDERLAPEARRLKKALDDQAAASRARAKAADSLESLSRDLRARTADADARRGDYAATVADLWCADWSAKALLAAMADLEEIARLHDVVADLDRRIGGMHAALARFGEDAERLAGLLDLDPDARATDLLAKVRVRAGAARGTARRMDDLARGLDEAKRALREHEAAISRSDEAVADALAEQSEADLARPAETVETLQARDNLRRDLSLLAEERDRAAGPHDAEALRLEEETPDPARTALLQSAFRDAETDRDAALGQRGEAKATLDQAMKAAGGADLDQQRATRLEGLREDARLMAARLLGLSAARGALRRFRQASRGDMLKATEAAFVHMTRGEWSGLDVQPGGRTERLVGLRNGDPVPAEAMSTGTRGQLYLALRVAGYADFVDRHGPLPFITDDVHETFDDDRARAALDLSREMGRQGQAILFTHHRHLVDLARSAIPSVTIIDMEA